jgi:hypothetical protein
MDDLLEFAFLFVVLFGLTVAAGTYLCLQLGLDF